MFWKLFLIALLTGIPVIVLLSQLNKNPSPPKESPQKTKPQTQTVSLNEQARPEQEKLIKNVRPVVKQDEETDIAITLPKKTYRSKEMPQKEKPQSQTVSLHEQARLEREKLIKNVRTFIKQDEDANIAAITLPKKIYRSDEYKPSGKFTLKGLLLTLTAGILAAALSSFVYYSIVKYFNLLIVFQFIFGFIVSLPIYFSIEKQKIRSKLLSAIIGVICGIFAIIFVFYWRFSGFKSRAIKEVHQYVIQNQGISYTFDDAESDLDDFLVSESGFSGFTGYLILFFKNPLSHTIQLKVFSGDTLGIPIPGIDTYNIPIVFIALAEMIIVIATTGVASMVAAASPFCELDDVWYEKKYFLPAGYKQPFGAGEILAKMLSEEEYDPKFQMVKHRKVYDEINTYVCPVCETVYLEIRSHNKDENTKIYAGILNKEQEKKVINFLVSLSAINQEVQILAKNAKQQEEQAKKQ